MKKSNGITLVALVITIIILLILAGITISQLTGSGLFENAKLAEEKFKNAQEKEETILADYEKQIESSRETVTIDKAEWEEMKNKVNSISAMTSPIHLVNADLPTSNARAAGTYNASSSSYTKTNTDDMSKYLEFTENTGWKVLKSGWYLISSYAGHRYTTTSGTIVTKVLLNNANLNSLIVGEMNQYATNGGRGVGSATVYFDKNDIIDFSFYSDAPGVSSHVYFDVYAMFE